MNIKEIAVHYECIVAGGGTAGFSAAVTAARSGLKTLLIEEKAYLGGTATGARIGQLMGFANGEESGPKRGILKEVLEKLLEQKGSNGIEMIYLCGDPNLGVPVIPYQSETLQTVIQELVFGSGADVLLHTRVIGTEKEGDKIRALLIHNEEGIQRVEGDVIIDATFHGSVAADAGCAFQVGDENGVMQPGTMMFQMDGVDKERYGRVTQEEKAKLAQKGLAEGCLYVNNLLARPLPNGMFYCNMSRIKMDPFHTLEWSRAEYEAREQVRKISRFFTENVPGFERAYLAVTGDFTGLRESRRIQGKYVLTDADVLEGKEFPDAVAKSSYPIDIHDADGVASTIVKPKTGVFYIPYTSMVTAENENLILAGRCISAEHGAHACIRVMITCMRLGEAAGLAAYYSLKQGVPPNALDGAVLKEILLKEEIN